MITIVAQDGQLIRQLTYLDNDPWPRAADGDGSSLEIIDPSSSGAAAEHWRASMEMGGSPGRAGRTSPDQEYDRNGDGQVDIRDVDLICAAIHQGDPGFDLNRDGRQDAADVDFLVETVLETSAGDVNLDGRFDSTDLVMIFQYGLYEGRLPGSARWSQGDWNCDGVFDSSDLVRAFQTGRYVLN
jgi:hypothetical protein